MEFLQNKLVGRIQPVYFRFLYWENGFSFLVLGIGIFSVSHTFALYRFIRRSFRMFFFALGLSCTIFGLNHTYLAHFETFHPDLDMKKEGSVQETMKLARKLAKQENRPILYYFHADWCADCPSFELYFLGHPALQKGLSEYLKCKIDLTDIKEEDLHLSKLLASYPVPMIILENSKGNRFGPPFIGSNASLGLARKVILKGSPSQQNRSLPKQKDPANKQK